MFGKLEFEIVVNIERWLYFVYEGDVVFLSICGKLYCKCVVVWMDCCEVDDGVENGSCCWFWE